MSGGFEALGEPSSGGGGGGGGGARRRRGPARVPVKGYRHKDFRSPRVAVGVWAALAAEARRARAPSPSLPGTWPLPPTTPPPSPSPHHCNQECPCHPALRQAPSVALSLLCWEEFASLCLEAGRSHPAFQPAKASPAGPTCRPRWQRTAPHLPPWTI